MIPEGKAGVRLEVVYEPEAKKGKTLGVVANKNQGDGSDKVLEGDVALVLHTSGTTGRPKGERGFFSERAFARRFERPAVPLTHLNILTTMRNICNTYEFTPQDRGLLVMPLFHGR